MAMPIASTSHIHTASIPIPTAPPPPALNPKPKSIRKRVKQLLKETNVLVLDLRGTLTDWCTPVSRAISLLLSSPPLHSSTLLHTTTSTSTSSGTDLQIQIEPEELAIEWYGLTFAAMSSTWKDDDAKMSSAYYRMGLEELIARRRISGWSEEDKEVLCAAWDVGIAWPDVQPALPRLNKAFLTVTFANGLPSCSEARQVRKDAGVATHAFIALTAPRESPFTYTSLLLFLECKNPDMVAYVSAHADTLRHAAASGMRTIYIKRPWEDPDEVGIPLEREFDVCIDGTEGTTTCGLAALADALGLPP